MKMNSKEFTLIGRIDGSSSTRRQRKFATADARAVAMLRWRGEGYNTFWQRDGDGPLQLIATRTTTDVQARLRELEDADANDPTSVEHEEWRRLKAQVGQ